MTWYKFRPELVMKCKGALSGPDHLGGGTCLALSGDPQVSLRARRGSWGSSVWSEQVTLMAGAGWLPMAFRLA